MDTKRKVGTTGYCMSGPIAFQTAAALPDRVGAVATFHGGGLTTDQPDSPHLLIPNTKARFLVAIAENDDQKQPDAKDKLKDVMNDLGMKEGFDVGLEMSGAPTAFSQMLEHMA